MKPTNKFNLSPDLMEKFEKEEMLSIRGGEARLAPHVQVNCGSGDCNNYQCG